MALLDERIPTQIEVPGPVMAPMFAEYESALCDCFICGRRINVRNPATLWYSPNERFAPLLPAHPECMNGKDMVLGVELAYHKAIQEAARLAAETVRTSPAASGHA